MKCEKCTNENWSSITWINGKMHCEKCAADALLHKWLRLRKRFTKLNKAYKLLLSKQHSDWT